MRAKNGQYGLETQKSRKFDVRPVVPLNPHSLAPYLSWTGCKRISQMRFSLPLPVNKKLISRSRVTPEASE